MKKEVFNRALGFSAEIAKKISVNLSKIKLNGIFAKLRQLISAFNIKHLKLSVSKITQWANQHFKKIPLKSPKFISGALAVVLACGGIAIYLNGTASVSYIYVNGEKVGMVSSPEDGQKLVDIVLTKHASDSDQTIKTHDQITYETARVKKSALLEKAFTEKQLGEKLTYYAEGYEIKLGDDQLAVLASQADANTLLTQYQNYYTKPSETNKVETVQFEESITTNVIETKPEEVLSIADAFKKLIAGKITSTDYVVQDKDSWWLIARKNDMKTKEVLAGNPGTTEDSVLKPGQTIKIVKSTPFLNVISKGVSTTTEVIPFDVQTKTDSSLASGKTVVKQAGSDGEKIVTTSYVQKNGKTVTSQVLDEKVTKQAVIQVVSKGPTQVAVASSYSTSRGSGTISGLTWPAYSHHVNSYYGYRGSGFHSGIDFAGDVGDPIMAAASGTVVSAGWNGSYGKSVLIDHGNGVMTRYAHASQLSVSTGQQVSAGQVIGGIGATGNATGPHLHFEIIINGSTVNPANYLP